MNKTPKIIVVCHDAGGAEIVSSYVRKNSNKESFLCYVAGPAQKIFARKSIQTFSVTGKKSAIKAVFNSNNKIKYLLCGSSWASDLEKDFILVAKKLGVKTVVYLDHWLNYRERFGYPNKGWQGNLPQEIWVGDKYGLILARKSYRTAKKLKIRLVENEFFKEVVAESAGSVTPHTPTILFIGEPISEAQNIYTTKKAPPVTEFDLLKSIVRIIRVHHLKANILIRLHPAEAKNKYNRVLYSLSGKNKIRISKENTLARDLAKARVVVGMSSMALALAFLAGKKTISVLPAPLPLCPIPYSLVKLRSLTALGRILPRLLN